MNSPRICRVLGNPSFSRLRNLKIKLKLMKQDYTCGEHSGFPLCCRVFYLMRHEFFEPYIGFLPNLVTGCKPFLKNGSYWSNYGWFITWYQKYSAKFTGEQGWGYIPCPVCLQVGRKINVKKCDCYMNYTPEGDFYIGKKTLNIIGALQTGELKKIRCALTRYKSEL